MQRQKKLPERGDAGDRSPLLPEALSPAGSSAAMAPGALANSLRSQTQSNREGNRRKERRLLYRNRRSAAAIENRELRHYLVRLTSKAPEDPKTDGR